MQGAAQYHVMGIESESSAHPRTVLITGAGRRLGAAMARGFHASGEQVLLHCRNSRGAAESLADELNQDREGSAAVVHADLSDVEAIQALANCDTHSLGPVSILINNASSFYPTPLGSTTEEQWDDLHDSNLKGPFFLTQALLPQLREQQGCIINLLDIHAHQPLGRHAAYTAAKAGLAMLTSNLALDLAPVVRVNGIAPGAMLWPETDAGQDPTEQEARLERIPLRRLGGEAAVVDAALYLADADYVTGEILTVDGGRRLVS